jgi:phage gp36-like protein
MIRWQDKDPGESIIVEFDFADQATSISGPTVTVQVAAGSPDNNPAAILIGGPVIAGTIVRQRIAGGVHGVDYYLECTAGSGTGDTLTIDAVLPVRERPILSSYTPRYITEAQFERRFGVGELTDLQEGGTSFGQAEQEAASLIDGFLAAKYVLPLATVPAIVTGWAGDITRFKLWDERAPEEVRRRYDDALEQLRDLAAGRIALPPGVDGSQPAAPLEFEAYSATRVFTADTLADF